MAARTRSAYSQPAMVCAGVLLITAFCAQSASAQTPVIVRRCGVQIHANETRGLLLFPQDETFCPIIADPKPARSFLAVQRGEFATLDLPNVDATTIGAIGLADEFGLVRWGGGEPGDGFHLALSGGIFTQFDLGSRSTDLINADYLVGLPLTWRRSRFSWRLRLYHQSSHLGDEYVLRSDQVQRENLSFESIEALLSAEAGPLRLYGGGEYLFRREPDTLEESIAHGGLEFRTGNAGAVSLIAGVDVKCAEQHDFRRAISARAGVQIAPAARGGHPLRRILLLAEYYDGPSPYGQFFLDEIRYAGVSVHLLH